MVTLSRYFRTAPQDWLNAEFRPFTAAITMMFALAHVGCGVLGLAGHNSFNICAPSTSMMPPRTTTGEVHVTIGAIFALAAIACLSERAPCWVVEAVACTGHIAHTSLILWVPAATWSQGVLFTQGASLVFCRVRPWSYFLTVGIDAVLATMNRNVLVKSGNRPAFCLGLTFFLIAVTIWYVCAHAHFRRVFEAQNQLDTDKQGLKRLLYMVFDAACWVEPGTGLIVRSDQRLDAMLGLGQSMMGREMGLHMPADERVLFAARIACRATMGCERPVELVRSKLIAKDGQHVDVELFIADLRDARACADLQGGFAGFLIGIRFAHPMNASLGGQEDADTLDRTPVSLTPTGTDLQAVASEQRLSEENVALLGSDALSSGGLAPAVQPARSLCATSLPETLQSAALPCPRLHVCSRPEFESVVAGAPCFDDFPRVNCSMTRRTLLQAIELLFDHAAGGALLCVADAEAFRHVFDSGMPGRPTAQACDQGYMTERLRGAHISDPRFAAAFREFTRHSDNDRWPLDHVDERARGRPKDGAFLVSRSGYRIKCAAKLLGLAPSATWANMGTKHAVALACAWEVPGCFVFVRSDGGARHVVVRRRGSLHVYDLRESA